jgi:2-keto-4-pentenoate hydratase/2-oxohepta-3-ene-1,7-dioic acid hydratase in catechol pathway
MLALIDAAGPSLDHARRLAAQWPTAAALPLGSVRLLAPLPEPRQIRDCLTFELHLKNAIARFEERTGKARPFPEIWYKQPIYYKANRFSVVGHEADVIWPRYSNWMDFELELAAVIGKTGKDIAPDKAMEHIFGFTVFNDFSARDAQYIEMAGQLGPAKGKDFDTGNALGPWIVTTDEIGDPHTLKMDARINGERWGGGNSRDMHHKWPAILAHISASETLYAGEVIGSGTVGTGCGLELDRQLRHNDVVELEIEKIGVLRNRVLKP